MALLITSDNQEFRIDKDVALHSIFIRERLNTAADDEKTAIDLPEITGPVFQMVLDYCEHHRGDPPPGDSPFRTYDKDSYASKPRITLSEWEENYIKSIVENKMLFDVIIAANNLQIKRLLDVTCKAVADMIKEKTPEQFRQQFNIENDFTPEEEEQLRRENAWADDS